MSNPTTIEEVLQSFQDYAVYKDANRFSVEEMKREFPEYLNEQEALATIEQLVRKRMIAEKRELIEGLRNKVFFLKANPSGRYVMACFTKEVKELEEQYQALTQLLRGKE